MYPTISDLLKDLFGINLPLPIQSFGFMMALAFLCAAWTMSIEFKRKEQQGLLSFTIQKTLTGLPASITELLTSAVIGFLIGFKLLYIIFNYSEFVNDTQGILLSSIGNLFGGIVFAFPFPDILNKPTQQQKQFLQINFL